MATEARKLQVGIFIISATTIAIVTLIWLGASRFFEKTDMLVAYFSESVQGLEPGSAVKYRGVSAGRVKEIRIAPDDQLIEVIISVEEGLGDFLRRDRVLRAQLQLSGITGLRYVEIDRHRGEALNGSPKLKFAPPYPVMLSTPSSIKEIMVALQEVYEHIMGVDLKGISDDARTTLQAANNLLSDEKIKLVLSDVSEISGSVARVSKNLERITNGVDLKPAVQNMTQASESARALFVDLNADTRTRLEDALADLGLLAQTAQQFVMGMQHTVERLDRTVGNLEHLTEELRDQPSRLLFSEPPKPRRPGDQKQ